MDSSVELMYERAKCKGQNCYTINYLLSHINPIWSFNNVSYYNSEI